MTTDNDQHKGWVEHCRLCASGEWTHGSRTETTPDAVVVSVGACDVAAIKARLVAAEPVSDGRGNFEHLAGSLCGDEHRTGGEHRSWCYACAEWCYASDGCAGCRPDVDVDDARALVAEVERLRAALNAADKVIGHAVTIMEGIEMDTDADRDLHGRAIEAIQRGRAAALSLGVQS